MSVNKFHKQPQESPSATTNGYMFEPTDRLAWERNVRQFYHSRASNSTPSSSILNSPDLEYDRAIDQYQSFYDKIEKGSLDESHDVLGVNTSYENALVSGLSPTSSHSSNSENLSESKLRHFSGLHITNLQESPRRLRGSQTNEQTHSSHSSSNVSERERDYPRLFMQPTSNRRAPGFPKRVVVEPSKEPVNHDIKLDHHESHNEYDDTRRVLEEFFSPQQQQEYHQQKLLEYQQRSKYQQVEKVLPLEDFASLEPGSSQSSASSIGQRLVALKQKQQKEHYEHLLQQQYENRQFFEKSCTSDNAKHFSQLYQETLQKEVVEEEEQPNEASNYSHSFAMSPEPNEYEDGDLSSGSSMKYVNPFGNIPMPILEDGLSSEHGSDTENNNNLDSLTTTPPRSNLTPEASSPSRNSSEPLEFIPTSNRGSSEKSDTASRNNNHSADENDSPVDAVEAKVKTEDDEADTDLETDRLLGEQRMLEQHLGNIDANQNMRVLRCANGQIIKSPIANYNKTDTVIRQGVGAKSPEPVSELEGDYYPSETSTSSKKSPKTPSIIRDSKGLRRNTEGSLLDPSILTEGVLFRARYLGTTQLVCEGRPTKSTRMMQAEEAVHRIKAPEGENQPSTDVDLFISTEKVMVLNTDMKEVMMDHTLKTISYIADIGDLVVLMARRRPQNTNSNADENAKIFRSPKMICHIFESDEAQFIAQSIGQAFQVAYSEFLKANGIEDHSFMKEMDYQEVLNSQEIFGDELEIFAKKELQKEVVVPKAKGEILGLVIVESGWGSMLPTVVIANLASNGAAARCGLLNIGDQIIAINGLSLVGLPLTQCQAYVKNAKNQTAVKFTVVPCAPVVEVKIKRPNTKYQLGFSVQNGVICSLLRGGIAERGGVRVGHRIIEINNQSVVAVPHDKIVTLLATSVGEIIMKTMPTAMFRLLTGQENPLFI